MIQCKNIKTGQPRIFNEVQWKLLGPLSKDGDKNGWKPIVTQETSSTTTTVDASKTTTALPLTGNKKKEADDAVYKLHKERLAILMAIDPEMQKADLASMPEDQFKELVENLKEQKARQVAAAASNTTSDPDKDQKTTVTDEAAKKAFADACVEKKLNKNIVKDYFDKPEINVPYDNRANLTALCAQLGEYMNWDLDKLNANF